MSAPGTSTSVLLWAQRIVAKRGAPPHQLLELRADATVQQAQDAFHKVARLAHPDLHRGSVSAEDLEVITTAYALVAGAYQAIREQPPGAARTVTRDRLVASPAAAPGPPPEQAPEPEQLAPPTLDADAAQSLCARAQANYKKAEVALQRGDYKGAALQLKLAISAEPGAAFLRTALAQVEAELKRS